MNFSIFYLEPQCRADYMEALDACSTGIEDQHIVTSGIADHLQDMRMSADKYVRPVCIDELSGSRIISSRVPADMGHQDLHPFAFEEAVERMIETQGVVVAVSRHSDQRLEARYLRSRIHASAEVSGMPYLVDRFKERLEPVVEDPMSI